LGGKKKLQTQRHQETAKSTKKELNNKWFFICALCVFTLWLWVKKKCAASLRYDIND